MNVNEIREEIGELELELEEFDRKYDMEDMKKNRKEYYKVMRSKGEYTSSTDTAILKEANAVCDRYGRKKKKLNPKSPINPARK